MPGTIYRLVVGPVDRCAVCRCAGVHGLPYPWSGSPVCEGIGELERELMRSIGIVVELAPAEPCR